MYMLYISMLPLHHASWCLMHFVCERDVFLYMLISRMNDLQVGNYTSKHKLQITCVIII